MGHSIFGATFFSTAFVNSIGSNHVVHFTLGRNIGGGGRNAMLVMDKDGSVPIGCIEVKKLNKCAKSTEKIFSIGVVAGHSGQHFDELHTLGFDCWDGSVGWIHH